MKLVLFLIASSLTMGVVANEYAESDEINAELDRLKISQPELLEECKGWASDDQVENQDYNYYLVDCVNDELRIKQLDEEETESNQEAALD